jgi:hypothetical protein
MSRSGNKKKRLRNWSRSKETKETRQLNAMCDLGFHSGPGGKK